MELGTQRSDNEVPVFGDSGSSQGRRQGYFDGTSIGCYGSTEEGHLIQSEEGFLEGVTSFELSLGG